MFQDENGGPGWGQWPPGPNICSYFRHQHSHCCWQQEAQGPFSWGTCKLWDIRTMENHSAGKRRTHCPQPPAACGDSSAQPDKWERPRLGDPTLSVHFTAFWRRPDQRAGEQAGGCLGLRDGYCGGDEVLFRVWSDGTLHPCQKVQKCALKKKKDKFYDVYV